MILTEVRGRFMKFGQMILGTALLFGTVSYAIPVVNNNKCLTLARIAAFKTARPHGNRPDSDLVVSIGRSELIGQQGLNRLYKIEIDYDVLDGASSDSLPSEFYMVQAQGTTQTCRILGVKLAP